MFERRNKSDRGKETKPSPKPEKHKLATVRKQSNHNLINLWDERADIGSGIVRLRDQPKDEKGG